MERRSLRGLCVLLSAVAVNSQWLFPRGSSCCALSPWREFPMIPLRTAFDWPLQFTSRALSLMSSMDDSAWWIYDQREPNLSKDSFFLCPSREDRASQHQSQQQQNDKSVHHQIHSSSAKHRTDGNVHQHSSKQHAPMKPPRVPLEYQRPMKLQAGFPSHQARMEPQKGFPSHQARMGPQKGFSGHQARMEPQKGSPSHQARLEPQKGFPGHQARMEPQKGFSSHQARQEPENGFPGHQARMKPEKGFPGRQARMAPQKGFPGHQAKMEPQNGFPGRQSTMEPQKSFPSRQANTFQRSQAPQADTKPERFLNLDNSETEEVLSIPLLGFSPRELKITHHGNHIRVSASRTCSASDGCVTREMEKTYALPIPIAKGSMKASVDQDVKHILIRGLPIEPSEETRMNYDDSSDPYLTGYTDETEEILAEDVD